MIDDENISKLYQRGKQQTPPAHLDDSILNAARDAVDVSDDQTGNVTQTKDTVKSPFSGGWRATASIAAVLVITVILVPLINQESDTSSGEPVVTSTEKSLAESVGISDRVDDVAMTDGSISGGDFMREESAMVGVSMAKTSLASEKSLESKNRKAMLYKAKSARKQERSAGEIFESEAGPRDSVQSDFMRSEAMQQGSNKEIGYGIEADKIQPKEWLEKIKQLLDASNFEQAETEVEEFRRCYPDEVIGKSLLNRLPE